MSNGLLAGACAAMAFCVVSAARGDVVDDFENGTNHGNWFGINQNTFLRSSGGNPGGWLEAMEGRGEPLFQFLPDPTDVFAGDYAAEGVTGFNVDLRADAGFNTSQPDGRGVTLRLFWTNNGDFATGIEARTVGPLLPDIGSGWHSYSFAIPANSPTIPAGWTVAEGNGNPGTNADWQFVMRHIDHVEILYGEIGFAFPIRQWDIGMDNARLVAVPEPASMGLVLCGAAMLARRRFSWPGGGPRTARCPRS